jgi:uncharacterized protein YdhG (YjbR/CyaY superfamily)
LWDNIETLKKIISSGANPIIFFSKELAAYKPSKGAIQFPLDKKIPLEFISKITKDTVKENLEFTLKHKVIKK